MEIHAIHGFLGLPTDWNLLNIPNLKTYDLTHPEIAPSTDGFWGWARRFNSFTAPQNGILMGYSLGGRLGMHALLENPNQWKAGIIISTSLAGYKTEQEKTARFKADCEWAELFEKEPWEKVLEAWNSQSTFAGVSYPIRREENQFSRKHLSQQLRLFSRAYQDDLSISIENFQLPILWVCGALDTNFQRAAKDLNIRHPLSRVEIIENTAHRVPWEQPEQFVKIIKSFIQEVSSCL
jgi:2-succinyl-6-hydroxy-2,4-cyclohexadiene-1-carboxylate synthase